MARVVRYALVGTHSGELLTFEGRVIVHTDRAEMQWLMPRARVITVNLATLGRAVIALADHPGMSAVRWPLDRSRFHDPNTRA